MAGRATFGGEETIILCLTGLMLLVAAGCASPVRRQACAPDPTVLAQKLNELTGQTAPEESRRLADLAVTRTRELAVLYRSVKPALFHNLLVNVGCRQRGLCYQWAEDLYLALSTLGLEQFSLHWAVARAQTLREHNTVVVTARGQPFASGLVLDPWRRSGYLTWIEVSRDRYPWQELILRTAAPEFNSSHSPPGSTPAVSP